jgi:tripartite-type tricarboxylate transporter receptor subunit TctC
VFQMLPHIKSGKMRALAVTSLQPTSYLPDVPPVIQKVPGFEFESWLGIAVPAGTPAEIIARLNRELRRMLADPEVQKRLAEFGGVAAPSSPEQMHARMTAEVNRWRQLVKERNIEQQ